jgi:hypothetical protein
MMREPDDHPESTPPSPDACELARIAERNRLIEQLMEIDARQRHCESLYVGISLEVEHARHAAARSGATQAQRDAAAGLKAQFDTLRRQLERFAAEREWLDRMLAEFDGAAPPRHDPRQGHA